MIGRKGEGGGAVLGNTIPPGIVGASQIISALQYKQVQPTGNLANYLFSTFNKERRGVNFGSIKGRQKSKSTHVS
jgi:hypothetical protein